MAEEVKTSHLYHAEATVLHGHLTLPLVQTIEQQAHALLPEQGGYISQQANDFRVEGVVSFKSAYTQVAGNPGSKPGHKWTTLATSVVEGLNILDVVTADRIVAQISVDHPPDGYVPHVTFLGTRFENLRIAGHSVDVDFDLDLFGSKPDGDAPYTKSQSFQEKIARQHGEVQKHTNLLEELVQRYTGFSRSVENPEAVECSLVNQAGGAFPGRCHGHVIHVPDFGTISLANLRLEQSDYKDSVPKKTTIRLSMLEANMGCIAAGRVSAANGKTNGASAP